METKQQIGLDYVFTFGKYKGQKLDDVSKENAGYICWLNKNLPWFDAKLSEEARKVNIKRYDIQEHNKMMRQAYPHPTFAYGNWFDDERPAFDDEWSNF